jgi:hypothetical protein
MGCTSSSSATEGKNKPSSLATESKKTTSSSSSSPSKHHDDGDNIDKIKMKNIENTNDHVKRDEDSFQPLPGYLIKSRSLNPSYQYDKVFMNIFHHSLFNSFQKEFILSKEQFIIYDNREKECLAYNILLSSLQYENMQQNAIEKEKVGCHFSIVAFRHVVFNLYSRLFFFFLLSSWLSLACLLACLTNSLLSFLFASLFWFPFSCLLLCSPPPFLSFLVDDFKVNRISK